MNRTIPTLITAGALELLTGGFVTPFLCWCFGWWWAISGCPAAVT